MKKGSSPSAVGMTDYQAEDDHRTMMRAAEIMDDTKRMGGVHRHQQKQEHAMSRLGRMLAGSKLRGKLKKGKD